MPLTAIVGKMILRGTTSTTSGAFFFGAFTIGLALTGA